MTTGVLNVSLGYAAAGVLKTGSYNSYIGSNTSASADNVENEIVIGYNTTGKGNNTAIIAGTKCYLPPTISLNTGTDLTINGTTCYLPPTISPNTGTKITLNAVIKTNVNAGTPAYTLGLNSSNEVITYANPAGISGSVSSGYLSYASSANNLANSAIYQSGTNIGIGTTTPQYPLHVVGNSFFDGHVQLNSTVYGNNLTSQAFSAVSKAVGVNASGYLCTYPKPGNFSGTVSTGRIPYTSGSDNNFASSQIYQNGNNIGIGGGLVTVTGVGGSNAAAPLHVSGLASSADTSVLLLSTNAASSPS